MPSKKPSTERTRRRRERQRTAGKVLPFRPRNMDAVTAEAAASPGDGLATWGPDHDRPPLVASNFQWIEGRGHLLAMLTLTVPSWRVIIPNCRLMRWGKGERVMLPQASWTTKRGAKVYTDLVVFTSDIEQRLFEEAALDAVRAARRSMPPPVANPATITSDPEAPPF